MMDILSIVVLNPCKINHHFIFIYDYSKFKQRAFRCFACNPEFVSDHLKMICCKGVILTAGKGHICCYNISNKIVQAHPLISIPFVASSASSVVA